MAPSIPTQDNGLVWIHNSHYYSFNRGIIRQPFNKLFGFSFLFLRWDCGVHVIRHMQRFKNGHCIKAFNLSNSIQIHREIASDLVLHKGNREKQTILAIVCTNTSTRAMRRLLLWNLLFFQYLSFPSPHMAMFMGSYDIGWAYRVHHKFVFFDYAILFFEYVRQNEILIYSIIPFLHVWFSTYVGDYMFLCPYILWVSFSNIYICKK